MDCYLKNILTAPGRLSAQGLKLENSAKLKNILPDGLVVLGMGGSGLAGEILKRTQKEIGLKIPIFPWKDYNLPDGRLHGFRYPLYLAVSFSGNTEETLSGAKAASRLKLPLAVVATGGKLLTLAKEKCLPLVFFPDQDLTPRQAVGIMYYALIRILFSLQLIPRLAPEYIRLSARAEEKRGRIIAKDIFNRITVIYTDQEHFDLAYLWKITINETGKQMAFANCLPELHHNEISGFEKNDIGTTAILLEPAKISPRMAKRFKITESILKKRRVKIIKIKLSAKHLEQTWQKTILTDWAGYYLAKMHKTDPAATPSVDKIKAYLAK